MHPRIPALVLAASACGQNPAFDPDGPVLEDSSSTGAPPTATASPDPTTGDPPAGTTVDPTTTTGATPDATTTTGDPSTTTTTTTDDPSTGTTGADDPARCWDEPPDSWPPAVLLDQFADVDPADPELAPDGLSLVYIAGSVRRPFRSIRGSLAEPFPNGASITLWPDPNFIPAYPSFALGAEELYTSSYADIHVARFKPGDVNSQYEPPQPVDAPINTGFEESHPNATQDGTRLLIQRDDGPPLTADLTKSWRFWEYRRPAGPAALDPFADAHDVTPLVPPLGLALCPVLSPDGLHLLFSSTDVADLTPDNAADVVALYHVERPHLDAPWGPPTPLTSIPSTGAVLCASSITADGCVLAYTEFPYGRSDAPYSLHLAQRPP